MFTYTPRSTGVSVRASTPVTVNGVVSPRGTDEVGGDTCNCCSTAGVTVSVALAERPDSVAVMETVPTLSAVARP